MGYLFMALVQEDNNVLFTNLIYMHFYKLNWWHCYFYHPNFQVSGVLTSAFGQFELPALEKKNLRVLSDFLVMQSFSDKMCDK